MMSPKNKALNLTVPEPCGENFNTMIPVKGGRFCDACEKTIVDFRKMSDRQILHYYQKNEGKICGVFNQEQLNRPMPFSLTNPPKNNWKAIATLASGLFFSNGLMGQNTESTIAKEVVVLAQDKNEKAKQQTTPEQEATSRVLRGTVTERGSASPLSAATIYIKGTNIGIISDEAGSFTLVIPAHLSEIEVEVSYVGFEAQTLLFNEKYPIPNKPIAIEMGFDHHQMIMGIMIANPTDGATCEKPIEVELPENLPEIEPDLTAKGVVEEAEISIYPNPIVADLTVTYDFKKKEDYLFLLYDRQGQLVFAKSYHLSTGKQKVQLNLDGVHLPDGIYILQISDNQDSILSSKKIVKGQA